ncbi:SPOSA6832_04786 [Sporobolomyces salmonicolor]|uniref:SPOSA6832_04786-mRNA-1:cds n=1 Tax=Sporidiobolus salmonicolor TaxID=5005 RepID=A0A0D6ESV5_SPOSA|nr:SPOSA6832_04786 [Sporobolomyces salmonicolor]
MASSRIAVTFGAMTFGGEGKAMSRVHDLETCGKQVPFTSASLRRSLTDPSLQKDARCLPKSRSYRSRHCCNVWRGNVGGVLGRGGLCSLLTRQSVADPTPLQLEWKKRGLVMDTKLYPGPFKGEKISHSRADLRKYLELQLKNLQTDSVDMWYLHAPDRSVPYEETLAGVDELYKEGKFKRFGLSNYAAWEVAEIVGICEKNGWIKPTAYQQRCIEPELIPCVRKFGLSLYVFNPLGGGLFTGHFKRDTADIEKGSRFDPSTKQGKAYRARYWNDSYFEALELIKPLADKHGLTMPEIALRWITHHSELDPKANDNILIGASSVAHLESNLVDLEKGPLPEEGVSFALCSFSGLAVVDLA